MGILSKGTVNIGDQKIALECDGEQHKRNKEYDDIRDKYLKSIGYIVYRIPWKKASLYFSKYDTKYKEAIDDKLYEFLEFTQFL